ncbi:hypothetical protein NDU88_003517 [Pleurodeles waltl]|uniref:Uncharacterized protein n=1 Tax=Pleurodeles waltl TaxID=8319 RepID=A0AAV7UDI6_PLEWA|nr:hypothetical protein NDU88_003517 [Pleurodeles waltl]
MTATRCKKDRSLPGMWMKPADATKSEKAPMADTKHPHEAGVTENPVTHSFLDALFVSLCKDLQAVKRDLSSDLQEVQRDLDEVGERVVTFEDKDASRSDEIEWLQQKVIQLQDQQIDLSCMQRTLKTTCSRIIPVHWGVPTNAEGTNLEEYVRTLFCFILGGTSRHRDEARSAPRPRGYLDVRP